MMDVEFIKMLEPIQGVQRFHSVCFGIVIGILVIILIKEAFFND